MINLISDPSTTCIRNNSTVEPVLKDHPIGHKKCYIEMQVLPKMCGLSRQVVSQRGFTVHVISTIVHVINTYKVACVNAYNIYKSKIIWHLATFVTSFQTEIREKKNFRVDYKNLTSDQSELLWSVCTVYLGNFESNLSLKIQLQIKVNSGSCI